MEEILSKIYKYEINLYREMPGKKDPCTVFAITDSMDIAERLLRIEYPDLMIYSVSAVRRFTIVADKYSDVVSVFIIDIKAGRETAVEINVAVVTRSLTEAIEVCFNRYNDIGIREIKTIQMDGDVMIGDLIGFGG